MGKEIPEPSKLEFLEKFLVSNFALSDVEDNTSGLLNRGGIADLPFLRTLLEICQKFREPSFSKVINSYVLLTCAGLAASKTLLQQLLTYLNFSLDLLELEVLNCFITMSGKNFKTLNGHTYLVSGYC